MKIEKFGRSKIEIFIFNMLKDKQAITTLW